MKLKGIETKKGSLDMLQGLLKQKKVHGVFYTNDFFSQRYLCRNYILSEEVNVEDQVVKLKITTRVEPAGLWELENTLDVLVQHSAGDIPGYDYTEEGATIPAVKEPLSLTQNLHSVDLVLIMEEPSITYQSVTIAGSKFLLVNIDHVLGEDEFQQRVTLLFGEVDKLSFFSHFYNAELTSEDIHTLLALITEENISGKAILSVRIHHKSGIISTLNPGSEMVSSWVTVNDTYAFSADLSYIQIPFDMVNDYTFKLETDFVHGHLIKLTSEDHTLHIIFEN